ncbi:MAG: hypothetical protein REI64_02250 [Pedobacter sp.]|uniref:hypothetical protein n=1 Tax=Pedobacter sp. TaxID=1411316 RepID=UPI002808AD4D|nr:hypothetical protein [Pedobacter sp.]MDQ8003589.1 hypothetical protein [Pedobacter sp.]
MDKILLTARYVEGDLSESEFDEFEDIIKHDKELQEYLEHYKIINRSLDMQLMGALMSSTSEKATKSLSIKQHERTKEVSNIARVFIIGTFIALAVVVGVFFFSLSHNHYEQFKVSDDEMIATFRKSPYKDLNEAATHVSNGEYYEAKQIIEKLYLKNPDNNELANHYAAILMANNCLETSKEVLYPVLNGTDASLKYEAAYMIALSFLKEGNRTACKQWLTMIPLNSERYAQANHLLSKLIADV